MGQQRATCALTQAVQQGEAAAETYWSGCSEQAVPAKARKRGGYGNDIGH